MTDRIKFKISVCKSGIEAGAEAEAEGRSLIPFLVAVVLVVAILGVASIWQST